MKSCPRVDNWIIRLCFAIVGGSVENDDGLALSVCNMNDRLRVFRERLHIFNVNDTRTRGSLDSSELLGSPELL